MKGKICQYKKGKMTIKKSKITIQEKYNDNMYKKSKMSR